MKILGCFSKQAYHVDRTQFGSVGLILSLTVAPFCSCLPSPSQQFFLFPLDVLSSPASPDCENEVNLGGRHCATSMKAGISVRSWFGIYKLA